MIDELEGRIIFALGAVIDPTRAEETLFGSAIAYDENKQELARLPLEVAGVAHTDMNRVRWYLLAKPVPFSAIHIWVLPDTICQLMILLGPGIAEAVVFAPMAADEQFSPLPMAQA